jgi:hypothetical protein
MAVTTTDRTNAGSAYATALTNVVNAYVELAATERALVAQKTEFTGGKLGAETATIAADLVFFRHPQFAPTFPNQRLEDAIKARLAQLFP